MDETNEQQIDYEQLQELTEEEFYEVRKLEFQRSIQLMQELIFPFPSEGAGFNPTPFNVWRLQ